ncbi:MAG: hypothetical protein ACLQKA_25045 [Bryobacteraceae bacterium]
MNFPTLDNARRERLLRIAYWLVPPAFCLAVYFWGLRAWYQQDDFAWLGQRLRIADWHDFLHAVFGPSVHGTFRPLSERLFLLVAGSAFGTNAFPARLWVFLTQVANLALISSVARRMSNSRIAGFLAPILWTANGALALPMAWSSAYMHILCAFFVLLALHFLLRHIETGKRSDYWLQWIVFLIGFGVMESMVVYPAIAAACTLVCARKRFLGTLPLFGASIVFWVLHSVLVPKQQEGTYSMHFDSSIARTLITYWKWALVPQDWLAWHNLRPRFALVATATVIVLTAAMLAFIAYAALRRNFAPAFGLFCFLLLLAPVLPLKEHVSYYYLAFPSMGLALVGAFAADSAVRTGWWARLLAGSLLSLFLFVQVPYAAWACRWWYLRSKRVESVVSAAAAVRQAMPGKTLVFTGVDDAIFNGSFVDGAFQAFGVPGVYADPSQRERLTANADMENVDPASFFLDPADFQRGLLRHRVEVLSIAGPVPMDVTARFEAQARASPLSPPRRVDVSAASAEEYLRGDWYQPEGNHRWMGKKAGVIVAGPTSPDQRLHLVGYCPGAKVAAGRLVARILVDGEEVGQLRLTHGDAGFEGAFPLPPDALGKTSIEVTIQLDRTFRAAGDDRDLGLTFGSFEVR